MKRRIFSAVLAAALVLSLAACGGGNNGGSASSNPGGGSSSQPDGSVSDVFNPDGSQPDGSNGSASGSAGGGASSSEGFQPDGSGDSSKPGSSAVTITLNKTDVTLKKAGATFKLRYTATPDTDGVASFTSDKPEIATVAEDGTVTAVAPGTATITVEYDGAKATCVIRCKWDAPADGSGSSSSGDRKSVV